MARVAIELVNGGRSQAVCRTGDCRWRGGAYLHQDDARTEQDYHRAFHGDTTRRLVLVACPGCQVMVELEVWSGTRADPHLIRPHDGCEAGELGELHIVVRTRRQRREGGARTCATAVSLTASIHDADDSQVVDGRAIKTFPHVHEHALGEPGVVIRIWEVS